MIVHSLEAQTEAYLGMILVHIHVTPPATVAAGCCQPFERPFVQHRWPAATRTHTRTHACFPSHVTGAFATCTFGFNTAALCCAPDAHRLKTHQQYACCTVWLLTGHVSAVHRCLPPRCWHPNPLWCGIAPHVSCARIGFVVCMHCSTACLHSMPTCGCLVPPHLHNRSAIALLCQPCTCIAIALLL